MIEMKAGVFGLRVNGSVKPMDNKSGPFEATPEQEARLVASGLAKYVEPVPLIGFDETPPAGAEAGEGDNLEAMRVNELRMVGKELGLTFKVGMSKAAMIDAIKAAMPDEDADVDADVDEEPEAEEVEEAPEEDAPVFDAAEAVL